MLEKLIVYFSQGIWTLALKDFHGARALWLRAARIAVLSARVLIRTQFQQKASALTYFTLLSIVPVAALVFGIAKGFGVEALLERQLLDNLKGQETAVMRIIEFARSMIENTRGGVVAGIGIAVLLWTVIKMLGNIEDAFNAIWGVGRARSLNRKFSDYLSAMLVCPLLVILAGSLTVTIAAEAQLIAKKLALLESAGPFIAAGLGLLPYCFIWALFSFLYIFMPNTRVRFVPGLIAGIIAGTAYQVMQWIYIKFQIGIAGYNAVYGGFAALPLFLVWLQTSWTIVLLGAAVSWACQAVHIYDYDTDQWAVSGFVKRVLALRVVQVVVKNFERGEQPPTADGLAALLEVPRRLLQGLLDDLVGCGMLARTQDSDGDAVFYRPAKSTADLTIAAVTEACDGHGIATVHMAASPELDELQRRLASFKILVEGSPDNALLKDL
ncbi:MAG: YihY/virulence factor BrkB family protein [Deltaproteobacteria bacterium]|nr:YihY/virulence factor BrkB family protein [Deltaproteobacteria bacterium]